MRLLPEHRKGANYMCDSNEINEQKINKSVDLSRMPGLLLRELVIEYEDKLYAIKLQLKTQHSLLKQYEKEMLERERTKMHNIDLFSPIYKASQTEKDLTVTIEQIKQRIDELIKEQTQIEERIAGLKSITSIVDQYGNLVDETDKNSDKTSVSVQHVNDKGLSILEAQEIERQRIARDLHDSTVQNLTSLVHKTELCIKLIEIDSIRAKLELNAMSNTIKTVINEMRGIIYNLKPMSLDDIGLTVTVERFANRLMDLNNINIIVRANEERDNIHPVIRLTLFRIIQEACNNVIKHANATTIHIDINYGENLVSVSIRDNGSGFNINNKQEDGCEQSSSFGLSIMKERISLLSGTVDIKSEKNHGTTVTVTAPLTIYEGDKNEQTC
jgi:two-component system, NarL family, sensor histidine kinase DegS